MSDVRQSSSILIVDDCPESLHMLVQILKQSGHKVRPVTSGKRAIEAAVADPPELVLLDINMPEMNGFDVCRWLKNDMRLREVPVIFVSAMDTIKEKTEAFRAGGVDYVCKPFHHEEILARVNIHLQLRRLQLDLEEHGRQLEQRVTQQVKAVTASQLATIFALAKLAEARDDATGQHVERVQTFSRLLAEQLREAARCPAQLTPAFVQTLYETASLHDIGKVAIRDAVLLKPGKLTPSEQAEMQTHCELGAATLEVVLKRHPDNPFLRMGVDVAKSHHEKWDGSGYPQGLAGEEIPLSARIVAVADFYDALTSDRCYRSAFSHEKTCEMLFEGSGTQFEPAIVTAFRMQAERFCCARRDMQGVGGTGHAGTPVSS